MRLSRIDRHRRDQYWRSTRRNSQTGSRSWNWSSWDRRRSSWRKCSREWSTWNRWFGDLRWFGSHDLSSANNSTRTTAWSFELVRKRGRGDPTSSSIWWVSPRDLCISVANHCLSCLSKKHQYPLSIASKPAPIPQYHPDWVSRTNWRSQRTTNNAGAEKWSPFPTQS